MGNRLDASLNIAELLSKLVKNYTVIILSLEM